MAKPPAYAPELNPDEGIWNHLKHVELKNLGCPDISHPRHEFKEGKERLRHKTHVIRGCIRQPGLFWVLAQTSVARRVGSAHLVSVAPESAVNRGYLRHRDTGQIGERDPAACVLSQPAEGLVPMSNSGS